MIQKEKKIFRKMFIVTEYAALKYAVCARQWQRCSADKADNPNLAL